MSMSEDYSEYIVKLRNIIRQRNKKFSLKKGHEIHIIIFKIVLAIVLFIACMIVAIFLLGQFAAPIMDFDIVSAGLCLAGFFVIVSALVVFRAKQLKKQKDVHGDYVDYDASVHEYRSFFGEREIFFNPIDLLAHTILAIGTSPEEQFKKAIRLNDNQLTFGAMILTKTTNNQVFKFEDLQKTEEYNLMPNSDVDETFNILKELDLISIHNTAAGKSIVQIDKPESDLYYLK